ncbi:MAG: flagellar basal body P-ring formation chaperone FlgA [Negativicutes bacterium]|nr:flagellar basal body P-ring formation chaperone FlgA [Negativicutes bacterium]
MVIYIILAAFPGSTRHIVYAAESQTVSVNMLSSAASVVINQQAGVTVENDDLTVTLLGSPEVVSVPAGNLDLAVSLPYGIRYNAPTTAKITISVNGKIAAITILKFDVNLYQQVVVAARPINRGEVFNAENLRYERMDVGRLNSGYYTDIAKVDGYLSRRMLNPGMALNQFLVEKPLLVKRGSAVTIIARLGGIEVTALGEAMQDGREGQRIRVQNSTSGKWITAKVVAAGTVEI